MGTCLGPLPHTQCASTNTARCVALLKECPHHSHGVLPSVAKAFSNWGRHTPGVDPLGPTGKLRSSRPLSEYRFPASPPCLSGQLLCLKLPPSLQRRTLPHAWAALRIVSKALSPAYKVRSLLLAPVSVTVTSLQSRENALHNPAIFFGSLLEPEAKIMEQDRSEAVESPIVEDFLDCHKLGSDSEEAVNSSSSSSTPSGSPRRSFKRLRITVDMTSAQYLMPSAHHHHDSLPGSTACTSGPASVVYSSPDLDPYSAVCGSNLTVSTLG